MATKRAVLIGIDEYEGLGPETSPRKDQDGNHIKFRNLRGCVNDVLAVREFLIDTLDVKACNIDILLAPVAGTTSPFKKPSGTLKKPTYKNILEAIRNVARISAPGDLVYIHYSGHGACATTIFGALRQDKEFIDHCLVPWDIKQGGKYIRDLELGAFLQDIVEKGAVLTVVLDSCFSGGAVRGDDDDDDDEEEGTRGARGTYQSDTTVDIPDDMARVQHWGDKPRWLDSPTGFVVLAACLDYQKAKERPCTTDEGTYRHGHLSYWLLDTIRNMPASLSSRAIYDRVRSKVSENVALQTPFIVGDAHRFFFNQRVRSKVYTLTVLGLEKKTNERGRSSLRLDGGRMDAVHVNSVYAILPLTFDPARKLKESDILAKVRVQGMRSRECWAVFLEPESIPDSQWEKLDVGCLAVLQRLPLEGTAKVRFVPGNEEQGARFEKDWHQSLNATRSLQLSKDADAFFQVHLDSDGSYQIRCNGDIFPAHISRPLQRLTGSEKISRLISRLEHIARFKLLKGLENPGFRPGGLPELVSVTVDRSPKGRSYEEHPGEATWIPAAKSVQLQQDGVYRVQQKAWFRFNITNNTKNTIGCIILNFNPELGISKMHWEPFMSIAPYETHQEDLFVAVPESLKSVASHVAIVDTFKIFICYPEKDLSAMELPKLRVAEDGHSRGEESSDTLDDLLQELAPFCRDGHYPSRQPKLDSDWQTFDIRVQPLM